MLYTGNKKQVDEGRYQDELSRDAGSGDDSSWFRRAAFRCFPDPVEYLGTRLQSRDQEDVTICNAENNKMRGMRDDDKKKGNPGYSGSACRGISRDRHLDRDACCFRKDLQGQHPQG